MIQTDLSTVTPAMSGQHELTIRDFREGDLEDMVRIHNAYYDDSPTTVEQRRHEQETRPESLQARDMVGELDGQVVVYGIYVKAVWFNEPGRGFVHYAVDPNYSGTSVERQFLEALYDHAVAQGCIRVGSALKDTHLDHIRTLEEFGFKFAMRQPVTAVDPQEFDPEPYRSIIERLSAEGVVIRPLTELESGWQSLFFDFHCAVVPDIPHTEPIQPMPWDEFEKMINDEKQYSPNGKYVAVENGVVVGVSEIQANVVDPTLGQTMLTAVRSSYRRRGIATALKASALAWAKEQGMRRVMTDNEEKNPMLDLNKQLGFREIYAIRQYVKDV